MAYNFKATQVDAIVDDSGGGTDGTIINASWMTSFVTNDLEQGLYASASDAQPFIDFDSTKLGITFGAGGASAQDTLLKRIGSSALAVRNFADSAYGAFRASAYFIDATEVIDSTRNASFVAVSATGDLDVAATQKIYLDGGGDTYIHEPSANTIQFVKGATAEISIDSDGIYYDQAPPTTASAANAWLPTAAGDNLKRSTSSLRYKHDVHDYSGAGIISRLRPVTYRGKTDEDQREYVGFIAEEVAEVDPLLVTYDNEGRPDYVTYDRITAPLVAAVQELAARVAALESD